MNQVGGKSLIDKNLLKKKFQRFKYYLKNIKLQAKEKNSYYIF